MKTAEEYLIEATAKTATYISDQLQNDIIQAMEEYAEQFKVKWKPGLPSRDIKTCFLNTKDEGVVIGDMSFMEENRTHWEENVTHYIEVPTPPKP